jgi:hypothetical protein
MSELETDQPAGTGTTTPALDALVAWPEMGVGEPIGLGEPSGDGLGKPAVMPPPVLTALLRLLSTANAVPQPAMITTRPAMAPTIKTHGVRWTGGAGAVGT